MDLKETQFLLLVFAFLCTQASKFNGDSVSGCIPIERNALVGFKQGLQDPTNMLSSWVGEDCCIWEGVICDNRTGHVVELHLGNHLRGELNHSLLGLKHLNYLDLSTNNFDGISIPEFLGSFNQLKYLNLSQASLGGLVPHQLGNLSNLRSLDLSSNNFTIDNALWISRLSSLRYLNMGNVIFSEGAHWLQALNMLPSIVEIHLPSCGINTIPLSLPHVNFTSLSALDLSENTIDSVMPDWLFNISSLEYLDLSENCIQVFVPPAVKNLVVLKFLDLSGNRFLESKIPAALGGLCKLQHLDLSCINISKNFLEFDEVFTGCIKNSLETLRMPATNLSGYLPDRLWDFRMLKYLDLRYNSISGPISASLGRLSALQELHLSSNQLNGTIPRSLGRLAELSFLDLSSNFLKGIMLEEHFANHTKLDQLYLSKNQLTLQVGPDWSPPFQLQALRIGSCKLGPRFPAWLRMQENISTLDLSSTQISGALPDWFWRSFSQMQYLDVSGNGINGTLKDFINLETSSLPNFSFAMRGLDLSNNSFSGVIHVDLVKSMPGLVFLFLSRNNLSGELPSSLCNQLDLVVLDLSENLLLGELPDCWNRSSAIRVMDFSSNSLSGNIPPSIGSLRHLKSLHLRNNNLSGELPLSFKGCESLRTLDLGHNRFRGTLPTWMAESFLSLSILSLRSNMLVGNIPHNLSRLNALKILDLAGNNLSGTIPSSFGNFSAMKVPMKNYYGTISDYQFLNYQENMVVTLRGLELEFDRLLQFVIIMDLSDNNLSGAIPEELTSLSEILSLNLSGNHLIGEITEKIGALQHLEALDLSKNNLSGRIPSSMTALIFLSFLNLSWNNLSGKIPSGQQFATLDDPSIYIGNPGLHGFPLTEQWKNDELEDEQNDNAMDEGGSEMKRIKDEQNDNVMDEGGSEMKWVYMSMGLGFVVGFGVVFGPLLFNKKRREAYFRFIDEVFDMVYMALAVSFT